MSASPRWFRIIALVALFLNLLGLAAFLSDLRITPEDLAKFSEAQQTLYAARPLWTLVATGFAVIAGAIGCVGLLIGRKWSFPVLVLSLLGIIAQDVGLFVLIDGATLAGPSAVVMQGLVLLIGIALVWLGRQGVVGGWLV